MLEDIFEKLVAEVREASRPFSKKVNIGFHDASESKNPFIRIELLNFSTDSATKNFPSPPTSSSTYGFSFYIIPKHSDYLKQLALADEISSYFQQKPFLQWAIKGKEFEMAISSMDISFEALNQFWIAQGQSHQPVLFYKARISDI